MPESKPPTANGPVLEKVARARTPRRAAPGGAGYQMRGRQGRVIDALGEAITGGIFRPDEKLPRESELTKQFAVSRSSLREAIKVLAAKGLLETRQKVGTRVRPADLWNIFDSDVLMWHHRTGAGPPVLKDFLEMRQVMEPAAARLAAARATLDDIRAIDRAQQEMGRQANDPERYAAADVGFHRAVLIASHNAMFAGLHHLIGDFLHLSFHLQQAALQGTIGWIHQDADNHRLIFEAINAGDGNAASEAMLRVILHGKRSLIDALAEPEILVVGNSPRSAAYVR